MAIIKCPECQKEVSDSAISCPNCGYGVKKHFDDIIFKEHKKARQEMLIKQQKKYCCHAQNNNSRACDFCWNSNRISDK